MRILLSLAILSLTASLPAQGYFQRLAPIADATANQDLPTQNFGADPEFGFGKAFENTPTFRVWFLRGHIQFDLTPLQGLPAPTRARLSWYQSRSNAAGCLDVTLHRITSAWSEATVTWNNKPTHDATVAARACVGDSFALGWKTFDVTALVQGWLLGTWPNLGMVIRDPSESTAGAARPGFGHSRESSQTLLHPYLEVSFGTFPFGTGCGVSGRRGLLDLSAGTPALGTAYTLLAQNLVPSSAALLFLGSSNSTWNGIPLPLDLTSAGFTGCTLLVSGQILSTGPVDTRGQLAATYSVPNDPSLLAALLFHQVAAIDQNLMLSMTNGFQAMVY